MQTVVGKHYILELYGCAPELLNDADYVREGVVGAARAAGLTLLDLVSHHFAPQGVTAVGLLAESHLSIHTWPEHELAAADLFSCGKEATPNLACDYLIEYFRARDHTLRVLTRGAKAQRDRSPSWPATDDASAGT